MIYQLHRTDGGPDGETILHGNNDNLPFI